jgi:pyoverdine/dityrosine biosynthesis protein Dit1
LFIKDSKKIKFCLPAFPCKPSNQDKVARVILDVEEYLAVEHLNKFAYRVSVIYDPGMML